MHDVKAIRALLVNSGPLTQIVGAEKIVYGEIKEGTPLPAIGITHISGIWGAQVSGQSDLGRARVQVTVVAASYLVKKQIIDLVCNAVPRKPGLIAGVAVVEILRDSGGPDIDDSAAGIFIQTQDFKVSFTA